MKITLLILGALMAGTSFSQHRVVELSRTKNPNEISVYIDEDDPKNLLAGANIYSLYRSEDGGLTWKRKEQSSTYGVWGDPVIIQDTTGSFYHFHLSRVPNGNWIDRIVCQRSDDGGETFNDGAFFGLNGTKAQDKPWAAVNPTNNEIYVTWTQFDKYDSDDPADRSNIMFSKSADRGETWSEAIKINQVDGDCLDDDNTVEGAVPAVGPDGQIYVAWSGPNGLVFNQSSDGGGTWRENEIQIAEHVGGWNIQIPGIYRANGMPITKCDLSEGHNHGTIYVNWADQRNGTENTDIFLAKSRDDGVTWSEPTRVNQDSTDRHQFFTWMDIDQTTGNLWFVYHDRRNHPDSATDVYMAVSEDGGQSFKEAKISESPFYPDSTVFFGDYNNIAAHGNVVRPVWTRLDDKKLSVRTAIVDAFSILDNPEEAIETSTNDKGELVVLNALKNGSDVNLYDLSGNAVLANAKIKNSDKGFRVSKSSDLEKGIYIVEIETGENIKKGQWIKL